MFVERLISVLNSPQNHVAELDDALVFEADRYRTLLSREARRLRDAGRLDDMTVAWVYTCIADGWVDEHLQSLRDALIELGAVSDPAHQHRLLAAATRQILSGRPPSDAALSPEDIADGLSELDRLLLATVLPALTSEANELEPFGLRLLTRRYALELGLLCRDDGRALRTPLGDAVLALPRQHVVTFLVALEALQSAGIADPWRTPRAALRTMLGQPGASGRTTQHGFWVATTPQARSIVDPASLLPWRRIRRLHVMGLVEPVRVADLPVSGDGVQAGESAFCFRLSVLGVTAVTQVLREPASEIVRLAEALMDERTENAVRPLFRRSVTSPGLRAVTPGGRESSLPPLLRATELAGNAALFALDQALPVMPALPAPSAPRWTPAPLPTAERATPGSADVALHLTPALGSPEVMPTPRSPIGAPDSGNVQEIDVASLIQRAWDEIQMHRVRFALHTRGLGGTMRALGDRRALLQAWRELLRSAADAAIQGPQSPPEVSVDLDITDDAVLVLVHDSGSPIGSALGHGIDTALFLGHDSDYASDAQTELPFPTAAEDSTRLGLWRAHRTLTNQGAQLSLLPPHGRGTSVRVTLPRLPRHLHHAA